MNDFDKLPEKQQILTLWIIWFAISSGMFVMAAFAPTREPGATSIGTIPVPEEWSLLSIVGLATAAIGLVWRALLVPRAKKLQAKLPLMVIGLALCEACGIIALFVVSPELPKERFTLFWASVICLLVSAPIYARPKPKASPFHQS